MTSNRRHVITFGVSCAAAAITLPAVYDLVVTMAFQEGAGWLIEPWYYTGFLRKVCFIALASEVIRQTVLKSIRWRRLFIFGILFGAAWLNWRYWYMPVSIMLLFGLGLVVFYIKSLIEDFRTTNKAT